MPGPCPFCDRLRVFRGTLYSVWNRAIVGESDMLTRRTLSDVLVTEFDIASDDGLADVLSFVTNSRCPSGVSEPTHG